MAIRIAVTLEGVEEAQSGIKQLAQTATDAGEQINNIGQLKLPPINVDLGGSAQAVRGLRTETVGLTESMRILRPVLQEVGLHMGNMREFTVLARETTAGLAVAVAGAATVALVKYSDTLQQAQAILGDFLGSQARGAQAFASISAAAEQVGSSVQSALPGIEALMNALQATGAVGGGTSDAQIRKLTEAFEGLFTGLRAGHASITEANAAWNSFATALSQQGKLTDTVAQTLSKFPGALDLLKKAFNQGQLSNEAFINSLKQNPQTIQATISALQRIPALLPEAFDPKKPQSLADAFDLLWEAVKRGAGTLDASKLKDLDQAIAGLAPLVEQLVIEFTKLGSEAVQGATGFLQDLEKGLTDSQRQIANTAAVWDQLKVILATPLDAQSGTQPMTEALDKLFQMMQRIKAGKFALPELDPKSKQDLEDVTKDVEDAKTAFDDFSRQQFGKGQFITIGVNVDTKPAQQTLTKFTEEPVGKGKFITIDAKVDFPEGVPLPQPKPEDLTKFQTDVKASFEELFNAVQLDASAEGDKLSEALGKPIDWTPITSGFEQAMAKLTQLAQAAWEQYKAILTQQIILPAPQLSGGGSVSGGGSTEFGSGGFVSGPGSTTSDSIFARLSNWEYVMRAAAVRFYGVDFMHALNALRLPKDFFRGLDLGGLVLPPFPSLPRFAQGGLAMAGQSRSLTLVLDGRSFAMAGSKNVVDDLEQAADLHNLSRIGRAPGWVR